MGAVAETKAVMEHCYRRKRHHGYVCGEYLGHDGQDLQRVARMEAEVDDDSQNAWVEAGTSA